jgi:hypothetical protein
MVLEVDSNFSFDSIVVPGLEKDPRRSRSLLDWIECLKQPKRTKVVPLQKKS